jgi:hypothetical protein
MDEPKKLFIKCNCHAHGIELEKYDDEDEIWISFWHNGFYNNNTLWNRIKFAWKILKDGKVSIDDFSFTVNDCKKMVEYLKELI